MLVEEHPLQLGAHEKINMRNVIFEHRKFNNNTYQQICEALSKTDWSSLNSSDAETCYNIIIDNTNDVIEYFAPKKITQKITKK